MLNKRKLQGTDIFISNDRTLKERAIQIELQKFADAERKQGKEVKLGYQKITIDGAVRVWKNGFGLTTPKKILYGSANTQNSQQSTSPFRQAGLTTDGFFTLLT